MPSREFNKLRSVRFVVPVPEPHVPGGTLSSENHPHLRIDLSLSKVSGISGTLCLNCVELTHAPVLRRFRVRDETLAGTRVAGKMLLSLFGPLNVLYATSQADHSTANTTVHGNGDSCKYSANSVRFQETFSSKYQRDTTVIEVPLINYIMVALHHIFALLATLQLHTSAMAAG